VARNEYHFVITLQFKKEGTPGLRVNTVTGTTSVRPGETRQEVYQRLLQGSMERLQTSGASTLFFSLEPNDLGAQDG
jgi:hypothetical protein